MLLTGTSGDTGSAAIEAVRGLKWVDIVVILPRSRCTQIQELQMTTVKEDNVFVYRGTSIYRRWGLSLDPMDEKLLQGASQYFLKGASPRTHA